MYFWQDAIKDVPICQDLIENFSMIKDEIINFIQSPNALIDYPKYNVTLTPSDLTDYRNPTVYTTVPLYEYYWKAVPLSKFDGEFISMNEDLDEYYKGYNVDLETIKKSLHVKHKKELLDLIVNNAKRNCPTVDKVISSLENEGNLANCFISRLIPGSVINPHRGWTPDWMRVHLGVVCDPGCKITVGKETQTWEEGKILAFKDGGIYPHSVKHEGTSERIILSMDIKLSYLHKFADMRESFP